MLRFLRMLAVAYFCIALLGIATLPGELGTDEYLDAAMAIASIILFGFWRVWFPAPASAARSVKGRYPF